MAAGFFKRNEKVLMTLLLLVLAPAFAFTGLMTWYFTQGRYEQQGLFRIFGRTWSRAEFLQAEEDLTILMHVAEARTNGPFGTQRGRRRPGEPDVLSYIIQLHEVERLGLRPAGAEEQEALREAALDILTWYRVLERRAWDVGEQEARMDFAQQRGLASFHRDEYLRAIVDPRMSIGMTVAEFEDAVRAGARASMLARVVSDLPIVSDKELYDEYRLFRQKRHIDYVRVAIDRFMDEARSQVDEAAVRAVYDENPLVYRQEAAFQLRIAKADLSKFVDPAFDPPLEERQARYEKDKDRLYKIFHPPDWVPPEGHDPSKDYQEFLMVFERVEQSMREDDAKARMKAVLDAALARAKELAAAAGEWKLEDAFLAEDLEKFTFSDTPWFTLADMATTLPREIQNAAVLRGLFFSGEPQAVGQVCKEIVAAQNGDYIYRILGTETARTQTFEEAVAKVTETAEKKKAKELAAEVLRGWVERIRTEPGTTLESLAAAENTTVLKTEVPLAMNEGSQLRIDGKPVTAGFDLVRALFQETDAPGEVTDPVITDRDDSVYIASLREIVDPDMSFFTADRERLANQIRARRQQALMGQFRSELSRRAEIKPLIETEQSSSSPQGGGS